MRLHNYFLLATFCLFVAACGTDESKTPMSDPIPSPKPPYVAATTEYVYPLAMYGQLLIDVQMNEIFEDGKIFVDMLPIGSPEVILPKYMAQREQAGFSLKEFVEANFKHPVIFEPDDSIAEGKSLEDYIQALWPVLSREGSNLPEGSLIPLPNDYIVPGGRFGEVYYWDTYFVILGLLTDGELEQAKKSIANMAYLIDEFGHIPNGNRSYYLGRSQPPFFAPMVNLLVEHTKDSSYLTNYLPHLEKEYDFWMNGSEELSSDEPEQFRVAKVRGNFTINRYFDNNVGPRPEGYREDSLVIAASNRKEEEISRDIRAATESGWDFSSRWCSDPDDLSTIRTTRIAAVDLNSLLFELEHTLAEAYKLSGDEARVQHYATLSYERRRAILTRFYDSELQWFVDYDLDTEASTGEATLAGMYPLMFGLATEDQAERIAHRVEQEFLCEGGLVPTLRTSEQQWDKPNGWPPLIWTSIVGLRKYGHDRLAKEIARRYIKIGRAYYEKNGKIVEKYDVCKIGEDAAGGEYETQVGFGWTNGVFARLLDDYPEL